MVEGREGAKDLWRRLIQAAEEQVFVIPSEARNLSSILSSMHREIPRRKPPRNDKSAISPRPLVACGGWLARDRPSPQLTSRGCKPVPLESRRMAYFSRFGSQRIPREIVGW